ncbi:MAG: hypothetical protein ACREQF_11090 [Candidatus Binataceae bacterium]
MLAVPHSEKLKEHIAHRALERAIVEERVDAQWDRLSVEQRFAMPVLH